MDNVTGKLEPPAGFYKLNFMLNTDGNRPQQILSHLNSQQRAAVTHDDGPLLVLAGAGSGKTRVVIERAAWLVGRDVQPHHILAVTFTNRAVGEMRSRLQARQLHRAHVSTFHSWGLQILRQWLPLLRPGAPSSFQIYDQEDAEKILKSLFDQRGERPAPGTTSRLREWISQMKNRLLTPEQAGDSKDVQERLFARYYAEYQERLVACRAVDLDDLLFETVRLWRAHPDALESSRQRWRYLLIDEYQDTNKAQYEMVRTLSPQGQRLTVVGDPDQAIYSWRGADIANILRFEGDFPGAQLLRLEQNYRSTDRILQISQTLIRYNSMRLEKSLWSAKSAGEKIAYLISEKDLQEARAIAREIDRLRDNGMRLAQMAIFYRTHAQSRLFEDVLIKHQVPYRIYGGISFYQRREIKDVLAYLRLLSQGSDEISFLRAIQAPRRGLGKTALDALVAKSRQEEASILEICRHAALGSSNAVKLSLKQRKSLADFLETLDDLGRQKEHLSVPDLLAASLKQTGYLEWLQGREDAFEERKENIDSLVAKALQWQEEQGEDDQTSKDLQSFLEEITLNASAGEQGEEAGDALFLMTLHNSKGLEFDAVFLTGLEEDLFPHARARNSPQEMEEERRLCYVGMTRARERLYLSRSKFRMLWGSWRFMLPSRFLQELALEHVRRVQDHF